MHFCVSGRKQVKYASLSQPVCMHASTLPVCIVFKGSGQMLKKGTAHLFGGRRKGKVEGTSAASCWSFSFALFRLDSEQRSADHMV